MTLLQLTLAWIAGLVVADRLDLPWAVVGPALFLSAGLLWLWRQHPRGRRLLALFLVAALGMLRWRLAQPTCGPEEVAFYLNQEVDLQGTVDGEAESRPEGTLLVLRVEALRPAGEEWRTVRGRVQVQGSAFLQVAYGERLILRGRLRRPQSSGRFSYREHLARQGIYAIMRRAEVVERPEGRGGSPLLRGLYALRAWARRRIEAMLPEPQASLLVGILLGSRTSMPDEVLEAFSRSGTTHILAISGWNISIVAGFLGAAGRRLPRRLALPLVVAGIGLYTLFVGGSAAVLRSALMGLLYVLAQAVGRPGNGPTALAASVWLMTLLHPGIVWDIGFQLSVSATLGMFLFVPVWSEGWTRWPAFLAESLAATLASQLLTWPLIALYFRQFSLVVPLANLLACPALAPLMLLGTLALLLGTLPLLGAVLCGSIWLAATYMLEVVRWAGGLSWASLSLPVLGPSFVLLYYGGLAWWYARYHFAGDRPGWGAA